MTQDILRHLRTLDENLWDWETYIKETSQAQFLGDRKTRHALLHCALACLQAAIDIGNHWVSRLCPQRPDSYRSIPAILEERKAIPSALATDLKGLFSLRNVIVHSYHDLELVRVFRHLQDGAAPLKKFLKLAKGAL